MHKKEIGGLKYMKTDIHPEYSETTIKCACGNVLEAGFDKIGYTR